MLRDRIVNRTGLFGPLRVSRMRMTLSGSEAEGQLDVERDPVGQQGNIPAGLEIGKLDCTLK